MRKICCILALTAVGLMNYGCQIVIQSGQTPEETTQEQEEKPGPEVEPDTDPFLSVKNFGMYDVDGEDYVYRRGEWQISRNYSRDGRSITFNMVDPVNKVVYSLSGIKSTVSTEGQTIFVTFSVKSPEKELKNVASSAKVLKVSGDSLWLKTTVGPYYLVKM
ncbi:MAG: hypothetical protein IKO31_03985 [Bacteroidales bacterium]|nr:hypothetical protein [Bacteroidales bacterium]